eukprot:jgi/Chlat1/6898/Chrsp52S06633
MTASFAASWRRSCVVAGCLSLSLWWLSLASVATLCNAYSAATEPAAAEGLLTADQDFNVLPRMVRASDDAQEQQELYRKMKFAQGSLVLMNQTASDVEQGGAGSRTTHVQQLPPAMCYQDRLLPNLFLFGTPKAGSSTLWAYLVSELAGNRVWSFPKEQKYFGVYYSSWTVTKLALEYAKRFPTCASANNGTYYVMDGTPSYLCRDSAPTQIAQVYGLEAMRSLKFIATLRNPVDRIMSYFNGFGKARGYVPCDANFDAWARKEIDGMDLCFRAVGMDGDFPKAYRRCRRSNQFVQSWHAMQLYKWFNHFSPDQFLFIDFDKLKSDPEGTMFEFVNIPFDESTFEPVIANDGSEHHLGCERQEEMLPATRKALEDFFRPLNVQLRNIMVRSGHADFVPAFAARDYDVFTSQKALLPQ